jgi:pimeloyl-ACP methyl ester carboxylesterase
MTLSDGRALGYQCLGDPGGQALFFFHGTPGSRLVFSERDPMAQIPGLRLVTPDRPGYGLSDPKPDRVLLDWARDVGELADHLGIQSFAVAGGSGGGPHALACAYGLRDRVSLALVLSSPSPAGFKGATRGMSIGNRVGLVLGRYAPWLVRRMMRGYVSLFEKNPERFVDAMARQMAPSDRALLSTPALRDAVIRDLREAYRQGIGGQVVDGALALTSRDWGFDLRQIAVPVYLWHGEDDRLVSRHMAQQLAAEIPLCKAHYVPNAGHLLSEHAVVVDQIRQVLGERAA